MKNVLMAFVLAMLLVGCGSSMSVNLEKDIPIEKERGSVTIISFQPSDLAAGWMLTHAFTSYDYYFNKEDVGCLIGNMKNIQYLTFYPKAGEHTIYMRHSNTDFTTDFRVNKEPKSISFSIKEGERIFIYQDISPNFLSIASFGIAKKDDMTLFLLDEQEAVQKINKVLNTKSIFGVKMAGFGEEAVVSNKRP